MKPFRDKGESHPASVPCCLLQTLTKEGGRGTLPSCLNVFLSFSVTSSLGYILTKVPSMSKPCFIFYRVSLTEIYLIFMCFCYLTLTECVFREGMDFVLFTAAVLVPRTMPVIR